MKVRVLGCSGSIARDCRTTSFLVDGDILLDAGTGVGDLTLEEMRAIDHVFLTHAHLDHVAALPLMLDACGARRTRPVQVHALPGTVEALRAHLFNDVIWPDFARIPSRSRPFMQWREIEVGRVVEISGRRVEPLPAVHTVPACGFAVSAGGGCWVFSGDTGRNPAFWQRLTRLEVAALVIETAFSNREQALARQSMHLSPADLASELAQLPPGRRIPVYITHTKPDETARIMDEIRRLEACPDGQGLGGHDIRWLRAGQELEV